MIADEATDTAPFEARYSIPGHAAALVPVLIMAAPSTWIFLSGLQHGQWFPISLGAAGMAFFGPMAVGLLVRMADRRVRLRIVDDALWLPDHSHKLIPCSAISKVGNRGFWIAIWLRGAKRYPPTNRFRRFVKWVNGQALRKEHGDVWIYPSLFDCSRSELLRRI